VDIQNIIHRLKERFPGVALEEKTFRGETTVTVPKGQILGIGRFLASEPELAFRMLTDLFGIDHHPRTPRFGVVYQLYSMKQNLRLRLKVRLGEGEAAPSVVSVWKAADWLEREAYDLFGIPFENHPDLRRILLWEGFEGHPLRKDFPLEGPDFDNPVLPEA
jgi:NADH-quinone oxidoreductase subunit C